MSPHHHTLPPPSPPLTLTSDVLVSQMGFGPSWDSFSEAGSKDIIQSPPEAPPPLPRPNTSASRGTNSRFKLLLNIVFRPDGRV